MLTAQLASAAIAITNYCVSSKTLSHTHTQRIENFIDGHREKEQSLSGLRVASSVRLVSNIFPDCNLPIICPLICEHLANATAASAAAAALLRNSCLALVINIQKGSY